MIPYKSYEEMSAEERRDCLSDWGITFKDDETEVVRGIHRGHPLSDLMLADLLGNNQNDVAERSVATEAK